MKALLESKISQGFEGFEDFICTGLYGFVPSSISSGTVRCYNRSQNMFSINPRNPTSTTDQRNVSVEEVKLVLFKILIT